MKRIIEKKRWKHITTKIVNIKKISNIVYDGRDMIESCNRIYREGSKSYKQRMYCNCCGTKWNDNSNIILVFTDKGNKLICEDCKNKLEI